MLPKEPLSLDQLEFMLYEEESMLGSEGSIHTYHEDKKIYLLKLFASYFTGKGDFYPEYYKNKKIMDNKYQKLSILYDMKNSFDNEIKPLKAFTFEDVFVSYMMSDLRKLPTLIPKNIKRNIIYLKLISQKLKRFHQLGIVYGDIKDIHIFVDPKMHKISFCDIDNMQVGKYPMDCLPEQLLYFQKHYGQIDEKADNYMLNLLTIQLLENVSCINHVDQYIENDKPVKMLKSHRAKSIIRDMRNLDRNYKGELLIDLL